MSIKIVSKCYITNTMLQFYRLLKIYINFYYFSNSWLRYRFFVSPATYPKFYSPSSTFSVSLPIVLCQLSFSMLFSLSFSLSLFLSLFLCLSLFLSLSQCYPPLTLSLPFPFFCFCLFKVSGTSRPRGFQRGQ